MIAYTCPHCGKQLEIPEQYAGKQGKCKGCGKLITVPPQSIPANTTQDAAIVSVKRRARSRSALVVLLAGSVSIAGIGILMYIFSTFQRADNHADDESPVEIATNAIVADIVMDEEQTHSRASAENDEVSESAEARVNAENPSRIYVRANAIGDESGRDWDNACLSIQKGATRPEVEEIWVAQGVYSPAFTVPEGVHVLGGFRGDETEEGDRRPELNRAFLLPPSSDPDILSVMSEGKISGLWIGGCWTRFSDNARVSGLLEVEGEIQIHFHRDRIENVVENAAGPVKSQVTEYLIDSRTYEKGATLSMDGGGGSVMTGFAVDINWLGTDQLSQLEPFSPVPRK